MNSRIDETSFIDKNIDTNLVVTDSVKYLTELFEKGKQKTAKYFKLTDSQKLF